MFSLIVPVHVSPTFAVSLETCVSTLTSSAVPASTVTPGFAAGAGVDGRGFGLDDVLAGYSAGRGIGWMYQKRLDDLVGHRLAPPI